MPTAMEMRQKGGTPAAPCKSLKSSHFRMGLKTFECRKDYGFVIFTQCWRNAGGRQVGS